MSLDLTTDRLLRLYTAAPHAFWRHDVDVSLEAAVKMARFAELAGVHATFAIMARGEFYNPFSYPGQEAIHAIKEAGHRLIPHVHYRQSDSNSIYQVVQSDCSLWEENYSGLFDLNLVCFHMPPKAVLWNRYPIPGVDASREARVRHWYRHCHEPQWLGKYVSDSRREWNEEKNERVLLEGNNLQIALHPEHWFYNGLDAVPNVGRRLGEVTV